MLSVHEAQRSSFGEVEGGGAGDVDPWLLKLISEQLLETYNDSQGSHRHLKSVLCSSAPPKTCGRRVWLSSHVR